MGKTDTAKLWDAIELHLEGKDPKYQQKDGVFPKKFLLALRAAVECGLSCDEITAIVLLLTGLEEMKARFEVRNLLERVASIVSSMKGDRL